MSDIAKAPGGSGGRRSDVLRVLQAADAPLGIAQLADELGIHPNTVRFHLDTLVDEGRVEHAESDHRGRGRPAQMFRAVPGMDRGGVRRYRLLAEILAIGMAADENPSAKALAAGRAWGQRFKRAGDTDAPDDTVAPVGTEEAVERLVGMLDELGFAPERAESEGQTQLGLRHCPFLELAEARTDVICPIHLGLMQGALETWDAPLAVDHLDAFAEPDLCLAHLTAAAPAKRAPGGGRVRVEHFPTGRVRVEGVTG